MVLKTVNQTWDSVPCVSKAHLLFSILNEILSLIHFIRKMTCGIGENEKEMGSVNLTHKKYKTYNVEIQNLYYK